MRRVDARDMAWATGLVVVATAGWVVRVRLMSGAPARTSVRRRLSVTHRPGDRRLAAGALRNMVTAPGTATWVRAPGEKALHALFPGDCRLRSDGEGDDDAGDVIIAFTDQHVSSGIWSVPEGFTIPGARAAGVVVDASTGYTVTCVIWQVNSGNGSVPPASGQDPVTRWREAMDRLGRVRTVRVTP
ncbi:MAG: hypothetical protein QG622_3536 [Actinomycetota bacterium]|nr:hypothetical protein [Actinomycetota bacterium]